MKRILVDQSESYKPQHRQYFTRLFIASQKKTINQNTDLQRLILYQVIYS